MQISDPRIRHCLQQFQLEKLFIEELGWDHHNNQLILEVDDEAYTLSAVAEKRGVQVFECQADTNGKIPERNIRQKIEKRVTKSAYEHLIVFVNAAKTEQIWQWVARRPGQPTAYREHSYHRSQSGDSLIQKLRTIYFPISEEEEIGLTDTVQRLRDAFDRDRVTKKFYDRFKTEHTAFLKFIEGVTIQGDKEWYASLMLNRLMFVYFIQRKGFLDGDPNYLKNRLQMVQDKEGKDQFLTFYRYFLVCLFHQGFSKQPDYRELSPDLQELLGNVPYLNGGLFDVHELEQKHAEIDIPDEAFERLFAFFDQYEWHLDARPLSNDKEINPDVLGYIFEKYINQKQMGAYYTKEDITEYISKNTIIPYLFDAAEKKCAVAFQPNTALWRLLKDDPDRYIYPAVRKGVIDEYGEVIPLPEDIAKGVDDVSQRDNWNRPADSEFALPTETWREHVARRQRCLEVRYKLLNGEVHQINDLITYNLDIRQFAEDAIDACEGPELLRAFYKAIFSVTVLDPTCGSGAFLFAALNILEPLYEACLERMQAFVEDLERSGEPHHPEKFSDFRNILAEVNRHPNRSYFILKSIIINNLYGVDIMEEAVEICKLRLFLKLVAQVGNTKDLEPLPDIDFNIRPGNTLVGFVSVEDVRRAATYESSGQGRLLFDNDDAIRRIEEDAEIVDRAFRKFHEMQTKYGMDTQDFTYAKQELRKRLNRLVNELNIYLASEYGINISKKEKYEKWLESHQPFHWFAEFYGIMQQGGFGIVFGNPPYIEYSKVQKKYQIINFTTISCGNLYAPCIERSYSFLSLEGRFGFIVQAPIVSTERMFQVRNLLQKQSSLLLYSTYDDRPSKLFEGINHCRLAIVLSQKTNKSKLISIGTTKYHKWYKEERKYLFENIIYSMIPANKEKKFIPKFRNQIELLIYSKLQALPYSLAKIMVAINPKYHLFYKITGVGHWFSFTLNPPKFWRDGREENSSRESKANFETKLLRDTAYCCLCSSLHYWIYQARTNCRDFNPSDLQYLPIPKTIANGLSEFSLLATQIMQRLEETSEVGSGNYTVGGHVQYQKFKPKTAKLLFDKVDTVLAVHYGFSDEELDFIINYDIKYRMGADVS